MHHEETEINPSELLTALVENLNVQFFADNRTDAKRLYHTIADGEEVPFMHIGFPNGQEIKCNLAMDHSQHKGKLSFSKFRKSLATMMHSLTIRLEEKQDFNILHSQEGDMIFNTPGIIKTDDDVNVLVSGLRQTAPGLATIRLLFLDPEKYAPLNSPTGEKVFDQV